MVADDSRYIVKNSIIFHLSQYHALKAFRAQQLSTTAVQELSSCNWEGTGRLLEVCWLAGRTRHKVKANHH
jgi:hypothetical protein